MPKPRGFTIANGVVLHEYYPICDRKTAGTFALRNDLLYCLTDPKIGSEPSQTVPSICIILLNWNGKADTLACLASLAAVDYPHFQILVVDNGSTDDSVAVFRALYPMLPILETHANLGFAGGNNRAIEWALGKSYEWIVLLNNDTTVDPHFLRALMQAAAVEPKARILGAKIYRAGDPQRIDHLGGVWDKDCAEFRSLAAGQLDEGQFETMREVDYVCGAALCMHRSVPETIGFLEARFFLFWEESDFCVRARRAGYEIWTAPQAKVWHKVSASFIGGKPHAQYFWWRSRLLWIERNCALRELCAIYMRIVLPEIGRWMRHWILKELECLARRWIQGKEEARALEKRRRYRAGIGGIRDYFRRQFGNAPAWVLYSKAKS